ncbi:MAG: DNA mismatch repair protein MutS, partial [Myxococcota bacterium]
MAKPDTPLMQQWREVKARHQDALVFFRVGDFYEFFYEDAEEGSRLLGLTLTARNNGSAAKVPLAGIPVRALDDYLARLIKQGRRVAICEQVEDPADANGIVRREVVETVTPGTVLHDQLLDARRNNYVAAAVSGSDGVYGLAALDLSTGELSVTSVSEHDLDGELGRLAPSELLLPTSAGAGSVASERAAESGATRTYRADWIFDYETASSSLERSFGLQSLEGLGFGSGDDALVRAAGALVAYVNEIQPAGTKHIRPPRISRPGGVMLLDEMTRRNLELVAPLRMGEEAGTLLGTIDSTRTPMGARLLRRWVLNPLLDAERIWRRQDAVTGLFESADVRTVARQQLGRIADLERMAGKLGAGRAVPRELLAIANSLDAVDPLMDVLAEAPNEAVSALVTGVDRMPAVRERIRAAIAPDTPASLADGGVIAVGHDAELDELRSLRDGAVDFIAALQVRERERTGISSLKVGFNKVFGYYLEVTRSNLDRVPDDYVRKQTLANAERYFTPELKEWEEKVSQAEEGILKRETHLFTTLRAGLEVEVSRLQALAEAVARVDVLAAFAEHAQRADYVRPEVHTGFDLEIVEGRHPVVEEMTGRSHFIPNSLRLDEDRRIVVLTGPNMAGKSTVLRQIGL